MLYKPFLTFLIIIIFTACVDIKNNGVQIFNNTYNTKKASLNRIDSFVIQEDSSFYIGMFGNVKFRKGRMVIADRLRPALYYINLNGKNNKTLIWEKGSGPGEVYAIESFEILGDRIYISDMGNRRWSIFDSTGTFIRSAKPFADPKSSTQGLYYENGGIMEVYENNIYTTIIEVQYSRPSEYNNSKTIVQLDSSLTINNAFGFVDNIYKQYNIYMPTPALTIDYKGYIYFTQVPTFRIYRFDSKGNFLKAFGVQGKFRMIDEDISAYQSIREINRQAQKFSHTVGIFSTPHGYLLFQFADLTDEFFVSRSLLDRKNYLKVYDEKGNYIPSDIRLPGIILTIDNNGSIYIYENDTPEMRRIGIYKLEIFGN